MGAGPAWPPWPERTGPAWGPGGNVTMWQGQTAGPGSAPHPSPHPVSPSGTPPHQRPGPWSPVAPEHFRVKLACLHCGIHIREGWIRCTLVNRSSTMIKTYIPVFRGTLMPGLGGRGLDTRRGPRRAAPLTFSGHAGPSGATRSWLFTLRRLLLQTTSPRAVASPLGKQRAFRLWSVDAPWVC